MEDSPPSEPAPTCEPWHDTPVCPLERGGLPCMGPLTAADELLGPDELWCCACGRKSAATPEQVAHAKRADAAWEAEQDRIMRRPGLSQPPDCPPQMDEYLRDTARSGGEP